MQINFNEIDEITDAIKFCDSKVKSGNSVLDVVLTEKAFLCNSNDISLTCLIDGSKLSFMEERDLYSIFGNAFDNAIEASKDLPNSKRVISLTSKTNNNIYVITMKNYTNVEPIFVDNLPQTTKNDKNYHGYGMKSIKRAVEKYNGQVPKSIDELVKFKGVGRKTANLVMAKGFDEPAICVDVHVHRISNRLGWVKTKTPDETEMELRKLLPVKYWLDINTILVTFGQNLCKPQRPMCNNCPVKQYCQSYNDCTGS